MCVCVCVCEEDNWGEAKGWKEKRERERQAERNRWRHTCASPSLGRRWKWFPEGQRESDGGEEEGERHSYNRAGGSQILQISSTQRIILNSERALLQCRLSRLSLKVFKILNKPKNVLLEKLEIKKTGFISSVKWSDSELIQREADYNSMKRYLLLFVGLLCDCGKHQGSIPSLLEGLSVISPGRSSASHLRSLDSEPRPRDSSAAPLRVSPVLPHFPLSLHTSGFGLFPVALAFTAGR